MRLQALVELGQRKAEALLRALTAAVARARETPGAQLVGEDLGRNYQLIEYAKLDRWVLDEGAAPHTRREDERVALLGSFSITTISSLKEIRTSRSSSTGRPIPSPADARSSTETRRADRPAAAPQAQPTPSAK
jgi:hypothetical protein